MYRVLRTWKRLTKHTWLNVVVLIVAGSALALGGVYAVAHDAEHPGTSRAEALSAPISSVVATTPLQVIMGQDDGVVASEGGSATVVTGPAGPAGADGAAGLDGAAGADGVAGAAGPAGPAGPAGAAGAPGSIGATGPAGSQGATGPAGAGLVAVNGGAGGVEIQSPDGSSYRIRVTNAGIEFYGPTSKQVWTDSTHFQTATLVP